MGSNQRKHKVVSHDTSDKLVQRVIGASSRSGAFNEAYEFSKLLGGKEVMVLVESHATPDEWERLATVKAAV